ncbi:MAG: LamG-like jellyroll fold domain-containing protein [Akkermansiaceae bacterium]
MKQTNLLLSLLPLGLAAALPLSAKLVAWYPLDEFSDANVAENIAGNSASLVGLDANPDFTSVIKGHPAATQALGTSYLINEEDNNGGALALGTNAAVQPTDQFTMTCFIQPAAFNSYDRIFESLDGNGPGQSGIRIDLGATGDRVRFLVRDGSGATTQVSHPLTLKNDGTWYFCAFRYDSASADSTPFRVTVLELTGDSIDEAAITAATNGPATMATGTLSATHGLQSVIGSSSPDGGPFALDGAIDEIAFYDNSDSNGVLSDADLALNAQYGPSGVELITAFSTDLLSTSPGNPATLSWTINEPFDSLVLEDQAGNTTDLVPLTTAGSGSTMVSPAETTTYYLKGANGEVENTHALKILSGAAPEISNFVISTPIVNVGDDVDLSWTVIGADTVTLDPGATDVSALTTTSVTVNETTTYTLTAANGFGSTRAEVSVTAIEGPIPVHRHIASTEGNLDNSWIDEVSGKNLNTNTLIYDNPLTTASENTNITATYQALDGFVGATAGAYQFPAATFELWVRPGAALTSDHGVLFETGGGQNGLAALISSAGVRFLGSQGDTRNLDVVVPISGMRLTDFIQVVFSHDTATDTFQATVSDTSGISRSVTETAAVIYGGNGAVLGNWGSGAVGGAELNLGGRTEAADASPEGLSGFTGETAIFNVYDRILTPEEIQSSFDVVATISLPPAGGLNAVTDIQFDGSNTVALTWNSEAGKTYDAEFSTNLVDWFPIEQEVAATEATTSSNFIIPPNQKQFFMRIVEAPAP